MGFLVSPGKIRYIVLEYVKQTSYQQKIRTMTIAMVQSKQAFKTKKSKKKKLIKEHKGLPIDFM